MTVPKVKLTREGKIAGKSLCRGFPEMIYAKPDWLVARAGFNFIIRETVTYFRVDFQPIRNAESSAGS